MIYRTIGKLIAKKSVSVRDTKTLADAIKIVLETGFDILPITNSKDSLTSIFKMSESFKNLTESILKQNIKKFALTDYITSHVDDDIITVFEKMRGYQIDEIVIVDKDKVAGVVSIYDLYDTISCLNLNYTDQLLRHIESRGEKNGTKDKIIKDLVKEINRLHSESITDYLTGLFNVRYFNGRIEEEAERSKRIKKPISVLFIDIDNFKKVNDTYGHECGDKMLTAIGDILKSGSNSTLRKTDISIRYGGEEFIVLLPAIDKNNALILAERIRKKIEGLKIKWQKKSVSVTVSIGISDYNYKVDENILKAVGRADEAMYIAKKAGKNKVSVL